MSEFSDILPKNVWKMSEFTFFLWILVFFSEKCIHTFFRENLFFRHDSDVWKKIEKSLKNIWNPIQRKKIDSDVKNTVFLVFSDIFLWKPCLKIKRFLKKFRHVFEVWKFFSDIFKITLRYFFSLKFQTFFREKSLDFLWIMYFSEKKIWIFFSKH